MPVNLLLRESERHYSGRAGRLGDFNAPPSGPAIDKHHDFGWPGADCRRLVKEEPLAPDLRQFNLPAVNRQMQAHVG